MTIDSHNNANNTHTADNPNGKVLVSDNGKGNSALTLYWAIYIISAVAACAVGVFSLVNASGHPNEAQLTMGHL
jgi:hypothetical protein